jgi:hypothetical protein
MVGLDEQQYTENHEKRSPEAGNGCLDLLFSHVKTLCNHCEVYVGYCERSFSRNLHILTS